MRGVVVAFLVALVATTAARANDVSRPGNPGKPTQVSITMSILDVDEIDGAAQSFDASVYAEARWHDPRLAHGGPEERSYSLNEVWHPRLFIVNAQRTWSAFPTTVEVSGDGTVTQRQRVWGSFSQPLVLRDFPFDSQNFSITLTAADYGVDEVALIADPDRPSAIASTLSLPDWDVSAIETAATVYRINEKLEGVPSFSLSFAAKRRSAYFVYKVIIPLILIVCMSGIVFWLDPTQAGTQIGVSTTAMLTLIAYRFTIDGLVPKVSYMTRMDNFIFGATFIVFVTLLQAVTTSLLAQADRVALARRIDRWCRSLFLLAFLAMSYLAFFYDGPTE